MKNQKGAGLLMVIEVVIFLAILGILGFMVYQYYYPPQDKTACTQEAKQCPDGSYVSRTETNCEFAECPIQDETAIWETYTNYDYGFQIKHPKDWRINIASGIKDRVDFLAPAPETKIFDFEIRVFKNEDKLSAKEYVEKMLEQNKLEKIGRISYKNSEERVFANLPAFLLNEVFAYDQNQAWIYIVNGEYVYRFAFPIAEENPNLQDPVNNNRISYQMLSTFSFLGGAITKEQGCLSSGGKVVDVTCYCSSSADFYNNCAIGGCTCTPDPKYAKQIKNCECEKNKCFNGSICTVPEI